MSALVSFFRKQARRLMVVAAVAGLYGMARIPAPSDAELDALVSRFRFTSEPLAVAGEPPARTVREVHPDLAQISAWISSVGAAVALHDLDGDGLPNDACHVDTRSDRVFVAPVAGSSPRYPVFALEPAPLPYDRGTMAPMGCLPGDFNEDGRADLVVYYWGRTPIAFLSTDPRGGAGRYVPREVSARVERWYSNAATSADLDGDGHLDLMVGNYFPDDARVLHTDGSGAPHMQRSMSRAANGGANRLLRWAGAHGGPEPDVRFEDRTADLDARLNRGWTLALAAGDLDGDLLPELYFANDFGPDVLLHNRSRPGALGFAPLYGRRTPLDPRSKVVGRDSFKGMGVDLGDLNGDGRLDLYVSNIAAEFALEESHFAFVGTGDPAHMARGEAPFRDRSEALGLARSGWAWEARLADFDNDGVPEALQATGFARGDVNRWPELHELAMGNDALLEHPGNWPRFQPGDDLSGGDRNPFFVRGRDGRYHDVADRLGLPQPQVGRGIATADADGDGDLDMAVAHQWGPAYFHRNEAPRPGAFLGLNLRIPVEGGPAPTRILPGRPADGVAATRAAVGAAATVHLSDGRRLVGEVDGGNGHSGKRSPELHFGLGSSASPVRVELRWRAPGGEVRRETLHLAPGWHTVVLGVPGTERRKA